MTIVVELSVNTLDFVESPFQIWQHLTVEATGLLWNKSE